MPSDSGSSPQRGRSKDEAAGEAWEALYRFMMDGEGQRRFREACAHCGLAPGSVKALLVLEASKPQPMRELATTFGCDPSWVTSLVDSLEQAGLAERRPNAGDRRVKDVVLTDRGIQAQVDLWKFMGETPDCLEVLSVTELRQLRDMLRRVASASSAQPR
jgi:DNA-binding MarR family transcriptional regulator